MPMAKTPTAIERITTAVRVLYAHRSPRILRQRGLSMRTHLLTGLARGEILSLTLLGDMVDRLGGFRRLAHQLVEFVVVERHDLDASVEAGPDGGVVRAAAQQRDLAEILAYAHRRDHDLGSA